MVHLARTSSLWKKGCPVCGSPGVLLPENTADREKGIVMFQKGGTASQVLIYDTAGTDFLSEELLVEIFCVPTTLMFKKARSLKNLEVWIFVLLFWR